MVRIVSALGVGLVFGMGLVVSGMSNPAKVLAFLDVAGRWDPSLAFVMAGAVAVSALGYVSVRTRSRPLLAAQFERPVSRRPDTKLLTGAFIFGIGWGLIGLCPGPALTNILIAPKQAMIFIAAMALGMMTDSIMYRASR